MTGAGCLLSGKLIQWILKIAFQLRLFDKPDSRKIHAELIPRLGGVAFMPVIIMLLALCASFDLGPVLNVEPYGGLDLRQFSLFFCCLIVLWLVGIADDLVGVSYRIKFAAQIVCAILLIAAGLAITRGHGLLGMHDIPLWIGMPLTGLVIVFVVNAINLIDGIDGLASGLCLWTLVVYGTHFILHANYALSLLAWTTCGVLFSYLYYNVWGQPEKHTKIFMGDTGTLTLSVIIVYLSLHILNNEASAEATEPNVAVVAFAPLVVPCFDVIRVYFARILRGDNPFMPDRTHIHHKLLLRGWSHHRAAWVLVAISMALSVASILLSIVLDPTIVLLIDVAVWVAFMCWVEYRKPVLEVGAVTPVRSATR